MTPDLLDVPGLTDVQHSLIQTKLKTAEESNRAEFERTQARWASRFSALYGSLEMVCNGVKEDVVQWLDCAKTLDLDDQHSIRTRPHIVKPSSQMVAASLARVTARAQGLHRGAPSSEPLVKLEPHMIKRKG